MLATPDLADRSGDASRDSPPNCGSYGDRPIGQGPIDDGAGLQFLQVASYGVKEGNFLRTDVGHRTRCAHQAQKGRPANPQDRYRDHEFDEGGTANRAANIHKSNFGSKPDEMEEFQAKNPANRPKNPAIRADNRRGSIVPGRTSE